MTVLFIIYIHRRRLMHTKVAYFACHKNIYMIRSSHQPSPSTLRFPKRGLYCLLQASESVRTPCHVFLLFPASVFINESGN